MSKRPPQSEIFSPTKVKAARGENPVFCVGPGASGAPQKVRLQRLKAFRGVLWTDAR